MTRFVDEYIHECVGGYPCLSSPYWSTSIAQVDSGSEHALARWAHPLHRFTLPDAVRNMGIFNAVRDHWLVMRGPFHTWPWRDPLDFASVPLAMPTEVPTISATDQALGTGNGVRQSWQIVKRYARGAQTYDRTIRLPVVSSLLVAINGTPTTAYTVTRPGGVITFDAPPAADAVLTCGYLFDIEVRFEDDNAFDGVVRSFGLGGYADITLLEVRGC